jgi:hypothetical protein
MTSAGVEAGASGEIVAAASRDKFAVVGEIDAAGLIAQDGVIYLMRSRSKCAERAHGGTETAPNEPAGIREPITTNERIARPEAATDESNSATGTSKNLSPLSTLVLADYNDSEFKRPTRSTVIFRARLKTDVESRAHFSHPEGP